MVPSLRHSFSDPHAGVSPGPIRGPGAGEKGNSFPSCAGAILAIDYGRRRLGLALSDEMRVLARPLATWSRTNRRADLARLRELCRGHRVRMVIVGLPLHLHGAAGEMAEEARAFAERLGKHLGLPVALVDERLSSWEAERAAEETKSRGGSRRRNDAGLDACAAAVILRDYLSSRRNAMDTDAGDRS